MSFKFIFYHQDLHTQRLKPSYLWAGQAFFIISFLYTHVTFKMQRQHGLYNQSKAQHKVMVTCASNVERKAATDHIKTEHCRNG